MQQAQGNGKIGNKRAKGALEQQRVDISKWMMAGVGPLEVPQRVSNGISRAVEDFARTKELHSDVWYHDEPIWLVRSKHGALYHEVQIAAFVWEREEHLFFIPQAYAVKDGSMKTARQIVVQKLITTLPLNKLEVADETTIAENVGDMLPSAWSKAESISENDLEPVKGTK